MKWRLEPVRVFCFHQVSDEFEECTMERADWLQTDVFKQRIEDMRREGYTIISLPEAHAKLKKDWLRRKKYAVLTADDGWASLRNILPWLSEQQIPVTLFLNPAYLDGNHYRERETERYLTTAEVKKLQEQYPLVTVGSHGWEHLNAKMQTAEEFGTSIEMAEEYLRSLSNHIAYHAYTWGRHNERTNGILTEMGITPVYMDGEKNYNDSTVIHRELIDW